MTSCVQRVDVATGKLAATTQDLTADRKHTLASLTSALQSKLHERIVDFDDYLEDISRDYLNESLNTVS
jgi:hypothetical protein